MRTTFSVAAGCIEGTVRLYSWIVRNGDGWADTNNSRSRAGSREPRRQHEGHNEGDRVPRRAHLSFHNVSGGLLAIQVTCRITALSPEPVCCSIPPTLVQDS